MWVGTQTSQVEIKLSLKACQVRMGEYGASLTGPSIILDRHWEGALWSVKQA